MGIPSTAKDIQAKIDEGVAKDFVRREVPELLFWEIGLEYIGSDTVEVKIK